MSTTATAPVKELTETEKKIRMNEITDLLNKLGEAVIGKDFKITLKAAEHWKYFTEGNVFEYDIKTIYQMTDRGIFAKLVDTLGVVKYYTPPDPVKVETAYREPGKLFMLLISQLMGLRSQELMIENHPGTYTILEYLFDKEDAEISGDVEKGLAPHLQYLYALPKLFWKKPISHFNKEVIEALEKTESTLYRSLSIEDVNDAVITWSKEIWDIFYALYQEPPEGGGGGSGSGGATGGGGGAGSTGSELTEDEKKKLKEAVDKNRTLGQLKEAMKELSKGKDEGSDPKQSFKANVEAEYDEKEQKDSGGADSGPQETDDILDKAIENESRGHGASQANGRYYDPIPYEQLYREIYQLIPPFKKKLASIMKDNLYNRQGGSYRTGKLDTKKLYKVATGSDKVFSRKVQRSHKDYKVTILIDESGSMTSDRKNYYAALGAALLSEVLSGAHIDFEIIGFNGEIRVYKKFGQNFNWDIRKQIENIIPNSHGSGCGSNDDGYAINYATSRMRKNSSRTSERMLFVLSDGHPAESGRSLPPEEKTRTGRSTTREFDLRGEIEQAEHDTYVFGIGINAHHVQNYYDNCAIVDEVSELPEVLLSQLKTMIRRG